MHTEPDEDAPGGSPSPGTLAARDREIMPPPPRRPPHVGDHLDLEELRTAYNIYHRTPSTTVVDALRMHFHDVRGDRRFAAALLPHGTTNICVRQLQALLTLGQRTPDDLIDVWIWWFNYHQPDRGPSKKRSKACAAAITFTTPPPPNKGSSKPKQSLRSALAAHQSKDAQGTRARGKIVPYENVFFVFWLPKTELRVALSNEKRTFECAILQLTLRVVPQTHSHLFVLSVYCALLRPPFPFPVSLSHNRYLDCPSRGDGCSSDVCLRYMNNNLVDFQKYPLKDAISVVVCNKPHRSRFG